MYEEKHKEWFNNYLYFLARCYPNVFMDLLERYIFDKKDHTIMIERYINHKTIAEISSIVFLESRQVNKRKQKVLDTLLNVRLS